MSEIQVGTEIPALELPPVSRFTLALYAGASGNSQQGISENEP